MIDLLKWCFTTYALWPTCFNKTHEC